MDYVALRTAEQMRLLEPALNQFVQQFDSAAPTIFFLPGGMASALVQATQSVDQATPPYSYETLWIAPALFCGGVDGMRMNGAEDANRRMTLPSGVIGFDGVAPYDNFERWCRQRTVPFNYLLLSWDWRLPLQSSVDFFTTSLLPRLVTLLQARGVDLSQTEYYLIGHSFGGQVVKLMLNKAGKFVTGLRRAITVATPFYGYGTSEHFYFSGFKYLNPFYPKSYLSALIATLTGPYVLMFLQENEYATVGTALSQDPNYPFADYPSLDAAQATEVDPYVLDPDRYPPWMDATALTAAAAARAALTKALPQATKAKLHHVRGITTQSGKPVAQTIVGQTWSTIAAGYDPDTAADPIANPHGGPGDNVVPAWSARLVDVPEANLHDVPGPIDHMTLMDDPILQNGVLSTLIDGAASSQPLVPLRLSRTLGVTGNNASETDLLAFLQRLAAARTGQRKLTVLRSTEPTQLKALARQFLLGMLKPEVVPPPPPQARTRGAPTRSTRARE